MHTPLLWNELDWECTDSSDQSWLKCFIMFNVQYISCRQHILHLLSSNQLKIRFRLLELLIPLTLRDNTVIVSLLSINLSHCMEKRVVIIKAVFTVEYLLCDIFTSFIRFWFHVISVIRRTIGGFAFLIHIKSSLDILFSSVLHVYPVELTSCGECVEMLEFDTSICWCVVRVLCCC